MNALKIITGVVLASAIGVGGTIAGFEIDNLKKENTKITAENINLKTDIVNLNKTINDNNDIIKDLRASLKVAEDLNVTYQTKITELNSQIAKETNEKAGLISERDTLTQRVNDLNVVINSLNARISELEAENDALRNQINNSTNILSIGVGTYNIFDILVGSETIFTQVNDDGMIQYMLKLNNVNFDGIDISKKYKIEYLDSNGNVFEDLTQTDDVIYSVNGEEITNEYYAFACEPIALFKGFHYVDETFETINKTDGYYLFGVFNSEMKIHPSYGSDDIVQIRITEIDSSTSENV